MSTESKINSEFVRTRYGIIRIAELAIAICAIISMGSGYYCGHSGKYSFYELVAVWSLILVVIFLIMVLFKLDEYCVGRINMPLTFLINDGILTVFYFIASILLFITITACSWGKVARIVASIFGVLNTICFGVSTAEDYRWFKTGAAPFPLSQTTPTSQPA